MGEGCDIIHRDPWIFRCTRVVIEDVDYLHIVAEQAIFDFLVILGILLEKPAYLCVFNVLVEAFLQVLGCVLSVVSEDGSVFHEHFFLVDGILCDVDSVDVFQSVFHDDPVEIDVGLLEADDLVPG